MKFKYYFLAALFLLALPGAAYSKEPRITIYESTSFVSVTAKTRYRIYRLKLKETSRPLTGKVNLINQNTHRTIEPNDGRFFQGSVRGVSEGYAAFSIVGSELSLTFEDKRRKRYVSGRANQTRSPVLYRFSKKSASINQCHTDAPTRALSYELSLQSDSEPKEISITAVADYEFFRRFNLRAASKIENVFSFLQMIYLKELSLRVRLNDIFIYETDGPSLKSSDIVSLLGTFRKEGNTRSRWGRSDLFHLFTAKAMEPREYVGLAYLGSACTAKGRYSYGITKYVPSPIFPIITAHEIGHNLNATHAFEGIMMGDLSSNPRSFSQESRDEIISFVAEKSGCFTPLGLEAALDVDESLFPDSFHLRLRTSGEVSGRCSFKLFAAESREDLRIGVMPRRASLLARRSGIGAGDTAEFMANSRMGRGKVRRLFARGVLSCADKQKIHTTIQPLSLKSSGSYSLLISRLRRSFSGS